MPGAPVYPHDHKHTDDIFPNRVLVLPPMLPHGRFQTRVDGLDVDPLRFGRRGSLGGFRRRCGCGDGIGL